MRSQHAATAVLVAVAALVVACSGSPDTPPTTSASTSTVATSSSTSPSPTPTTSSMVTSSSSSSSSSSATSSSTTSRKPKPKPAPKDPLTGWKLSKNPVLVVKIDNTAAGFPQFGITAADIIYTEQVEGGLTRLIAVFHTDLPTEVGAVRSIRSTDMELLPSYGKPILVGSGGAPRWVRALGDSSLVGVLNDAGAGGFWRSSFGDGTHNLHANLQTIAKNHAGQGKARYMGFTFAGKDARLGKAPKVSTIDVTMLAGSYQFSYTGGAYGKYLAQHAGSPYVDQHGRKVYVQNVLVQHVRDVPDGQLDPIGNPSYLSRTVGSGTFTLYRNGRAISGTWSRKAESDPTKFVDEKGKPVRLRVGRTWVLLAPQSSSVSQH